MNIPLMGAIVVQQSLQSSINRNIKGGGGKKPDKEPKNDNLLAFVIIVGLFIVGFALYMIFQK